MDKTCPTPGFDRCCCLRCPHRRLSRSRCNSTHVTSDCLAKAFWTCSASTSSASNRSATRQSGCEVLRPRLLPPPHRPLRRLRESSQRSAHFSSWDDAIVAPVAATVTRSLLLPPTPLPLLLRNLASPLLLPTRRPTNQKPAVLRNNQGSLVQKQSIVLATGTQMVRTAIHRDASSNIGR